MGVVVHDTRVHWLAETTVFLFSLCLELGFLTSLDVYCFSCLDDQQATGILCVCLDLCEIV